MFKRMQSMQMQAVHCFQTMGPNQHEYRAIIAIHNTHLGPALGGCRCLHYTREQLAFDDVMRLAQGMSYKAALANLQQGGGKSVILLPNNVVVTDINREFLFDWFGQCVEQLQGQYITAMDVGTQVSDMDVIAQQTQHVASASNIGDPAEATAQGVMVGIKAALEFNFNNTEIHGKCFAVQGLGHVGWRVAKRLLHLGGRVIVADPEEEKNWQAQALGMEVVSIDEILTQSCDVLVPCALGGVINEELVEKLRCKIIAGSANNQLADDDIAERLSKKDILYAPDYIINAGGLIFASINHCYKQRLNSNKATAEIDGLIKQKIEGIHQTLMEVFQQARLQNKNINQVANEIALKRLAEAAAVSTSSQEEGQGAGDIYNAA
ncbi:MAG: Glu/Leu/Phe/Val dehydrogenase [Oleispira sp.]|nr:Glu/Leu/Phe/Val dehydrogenase [Oleispira sp.]MBL4881162.1 Glu/Leu/Phe/Val dehydrogenase [Oleispira sp.]